MKKKSWFLFISLLFIVLFSTSALAQENIQTAASGVAGESAETGNNSVPLNKTGWYRHTDGNLYFIKKNHQLATGFVTIKGYQYYFSCRQKQKGKLLTGVQKIHGKEYYFLEKGKTGVLGRAANGWTELERGRCYCKNGRILKNQYIDDYYVGKNGAMSSKSKRLYSLVCDVIQKNTSSQMSKAEKLKACYLYLCGADFAYVHKDVNLQSASWKMDAAYEMLTTHRGVCYHFASAYAFLAREIGLKNVKVVSGKIQSRYSQYVYSVHGWVEMTRDGQQYIYDISLERHLGQPLRYYRKTYAETGRVYVKLA